MQADPQPAGPLRSGARRRLMRGEGLTSPVSGWGGGLLQKGSSGSPRAAGEGGCLVIESGASADVKWVFSGAGQL